MRTKLIVGNWKMCPPSAKAAIELAQGVVAGAGNEERVRVAVCPPFPYLAQVGAILAGSKVALGGQDCYVVEKEGAYTGAVSPAMLLDVGCKYVILGHSERRHKMGETDSLINQKVKTALAGGLQVILCMGETLPERQAKDYEAVFDRQVTQGLQGVSADMLDRVIIAYEPVWAIGTGQNATPEQAQNAHIFIRSLFAVLYGQDAAAALTIQYGGSVKPDNAAELLKQLDVDGALVGGASLKADQFLAIINAAH